MGKKEQRNNFSTTRFSIKLLCSLFIKSTIKNIMINLIITDVSFKFNGGFYLWIYHFSSYSLTAVFVSWQNGNIWKYLFDSTC